MSNEDRAPSPADGPAKVFGREPEYCGVFSRMSVGPLHMDIEHSSGAISPSSISGHYVQPERFFLDLLSALLSLIPAEHVVQAMGEETKLRIAEAMTPLLTKTIAHQLQEALARAEKAENAWRFANTALEGTQDKLARAQSEIEQLRTRAEKAEANAIDRELELVRQCNANAERAEQAERERDEARSELDRCKAFCRERIQEIHQWEQWADLSPRGANVDAPPSNAMHAAAEELRAQGAEVLPEAHSGRTSRRPYVTTHDDETLLEWWNGDRKLSVYIDDGGIRALKVGPGAEIVDVELALGGWAAARDWLNGTGRKAEESDAQGMAVDGQAAQPKATAASVHEEPVTGATERAQPSASGAPIVGDGAGPVVLAGAGAAARASSPAPGDVPPEVTRPSGIPASATIWAEVVDGLGRKVGAWFDRGCVRMVDPDGGGAWFWDTGSNGQGWDGYHLGPALTPSAAAQCRQLYEKGLAHLAAEATPKPTLTPVDLTELREAWNVWLGSHNSHDWLRFSNALEKLLSSGGAP